ncbi:hypothetical protein Patl1_22304 [Pistacia atlantica]|uniref:Uncharacterized protein n=1 Tax=Pistacia atlantica TaxID=434234 RepID=A0ACC1A203_9ROSI|nr:hypothetical protein Patl1_22304 [Pistacia atlantica]
MLQVVVGLEVSATNKDQLFVGVLEERKRGQKGKRLAGCCLFFISFSLSCKFWNLNDIAFFSCYCVTGLLLLLLVTGLYALWVYCWVICALGCTLSKVWHGREYLDVARRYGLHLVSLAIAFVLRHPLVASAVFGATKSSQLQEVINACQVELTVEIVVEINRIHSNFPNSCP